MGVGEPDHRQSKAKAPANAGALFGLLDFLTA